MTASTDYTARDRATYFARMIRAAESVFPGIRFYAADLHTLVFESVATLGDLISFHSNRNGREAHLITCDDLVNAHRHARKFDYVPRRRTATQVDLVFTLDEPAVGSVTFEQGWIVRSRSISNTVATQLLSDLVLAPGVITGTVTAENSERHDESYTSRTQLNQQFPLSFGPFVAFDSFRDSVSSSWAEVTSWKDSGPNDFHYRLLFNSDIEATVEFGDGARGKMPVGQVDVSYRSGGGEVAITENQITVAEFAATDNLGNSSLFTVTNPNDGTTGLSEETVEELKENVPASLRSRNSTIAWEDYAINAKDIDGVARAMLLTSDQDPNLPENTGYLHLVGRGSRYYENGPYAPVAPTQAIMDAVEQNLTVTKPKTVTFKLYILPLIAEQIDITARVKLIQGASPSAVDTAIRKNLWDFFAALNADGTENDQINFGFNYRDADGDLDNELAWSDLFNAVRDADGVRAVDHDTFLPVDDVPIPINSFPTLGTVTLINDATGLSLV